MGWDIQPTVVLHNRPGSSQTPPGREAWTLLGRRVVHRGEASALEFLSDWVQRIGPGQDLRGVVLRVLNRTVADPLGDAVVPIATGVVRHAPDSKVPDLTRFDAAQHELRDVLVAEPRREVPELGRPLQGAPNSHRDALSPVLVPVHPGYILAPGLAEAVKSVGAERGIDRELVCDRVHPERMVRAGEDNPLYPMPAGALVDLVQSAKIVLDDLRQRALNAGSRQVDQNVDAVQQAIDHLWLAKVAVHNFFGI